MTSQTIIAESSKGTPTPRTDAKQTVAPTDARLFDKVRHHYHSDHQAEYLDINAQVELLLQQLQTEVQKQAVATDYCH
ncbi:hypothetical protein [Acaryochloris sp. IP29b_bin.148]|uniref:hypothetical protein n=1 Tax=Acaryochloris sp. IP29b_bin.148 TaxID=2969218 RepID=UPI00261F05D4|nr:hypothetical protein [Acaryochloris sp. IP29b_bin.148]